jgi:hypothetical protein
VPKFSEELMADKKKTDDLFDQPEDLEEEEEDTEPDVGKDTEEESEKEPNDMEGI